MAQLRSFRSSVSTPKVSIIIPVLDQWNYTEQCLKSIELFTDFKNLEVIIIDNGSQDETRDKIKNFHYIKLIQFPENRGFAEACNVGARQARGEILCFLNNDTIVTHGWLTPLVDEIQNGAGIVGPKLIFPNSYDINSGGYVFHKELKAFTPLFYNLDAGHSAVSKRRSLRAVLGACVLISKDLFNSVGEFTDIGLEDVDLCLKVHKAGKEVIWTPLSEVYHYGSVTIASHKSSELPKRTSVLFHERWPNSQFSDEFTEILASEGFKGRITDKNVFKYESQYESGFSSCTQAFRLCSEGDVNSAIKLLENEVEKTLFHKQSHEVLATIYSVRNDFLAASRIWDKVIEHRPFCFMAYLEGIRVACARNDQEGAIAILEKFKQFPLVPFDIIDSLQGVLN